MKIGILTFHRADNFGAVLQCFALQTYLEQQGHEVVVLDYRCKAIEQVYYLLNIRLLFSRKNIFKSLCEYFFNLRNYVEMSKKHLLYKKFRSFFLHLTESLSIIDNSSFDLDAFITGSDQVWNLLLLHGYDKNFFLDFPVDKNKLKISYAASSEVAAFPKFAQCKSKISHALNEFNSISVREIALKEELEKFTSKEIFVCIDPTFLISKHCYDEILERPKEQGYVLVYHMMETVESVNIANRIAAGKKMQVIEIHASFKSPKGNRHKRDLGPLQILGYIKYADTVVTNSFHGVALSIILEKDFWAVNRYKSARLYNLLSLAGLTKRYIQSVEGCDNSVIDYSKVKENVEEAIMQSKNFLMCSLLNKKS